MSMVRDEWIQGKNKRKQINSVNKINRGRTIFTIKLNKSLHSLHS